MVKATTIRPAVLQNEVHPYHQSEKMKAHIAKYGTVMESWYPLGGRGYTELLFGDKLIASIAKAHDRTPAQIVLRWHIQVGNIAIPGSSNEKHIIENANIWNFTLTDDEMAQIKKIDRNKRNSNY